MSDADPILRLNAALEGRYHIERELGAGGMATVYLAEDVRHRRSVALKVLKPELAAVVGSERFLAEIETTANLQHPHILPLFDSGQAAGFLYYVMPYVEGESLRDRLDREHQLPVEDAVGVATSLAEALDYAHRQGVIHRDIKPANEPPVTMRATATGQHFPPTTTASRRGKGTIVSSASGSSRAWPVSRNGGLKTPQKRSRSSASSPLGGTPDMVIGLRGR